MIPARASKMDVSWHPIDVLADNVIINIADDTLHLALSSLLHNLLDFLVGCVLLEV
eukprot:gnl/Chilomastix_caulleri/5633.p3 GENE.gnl/Chilomastix_caulleri/5633~~gnl/Chilomastix_caulleri/5633.p3  ORF type:complete len:56 (-),score=18.16 gnl/Chilomastix_caulleri/5633:159-326(-)